MTSDYERALAANASYAAGFRHAELAKPPRRRLAVIACMDARITVEDVLGLQTGDAHVIRNAGGLATDDAIRSLVISQQLTGTDEVLVIEHTDCGMLAFTDTAMQDRLRAETGTDADLPLLAFTDLAGNLREQVAIIRDHPWTKDVPVHGLIYDVATGRLAAVD